MNLRIRKELKRIIAGIENAEQFNRDYPWKEKGRDYSACYSKMTFNEVKKHLPEEINYSIVSESTNCCTVTFWR